VLFALIFLLGLASSYDGGGIGTDAAECVDGEDNDNDDTADGEGTDEFPPDPACTRPFYMDNSEYSMYDTGASYIFEDSATPDRNGPSVFYGSQLIHEQENDDVVIQRDFNTTGQYLQTYMDRSSESWGGQTPTNVTFDIPDDWTVREHPAGDKALSTPPHPDGDNADIRCGDSRRFYDDGGGSSSNEKNCPEDWGLPANFYTTAGTTRETATNTITDNLGQITEGPTGEELTADVDYNVDMIVNGPAETTRNHVFYDDSPPDPDEYTYEFSEYGSWENGPDFYRPNEEELWMVYPETTKTHFGSQDTDYIDSSHEETTQDYSGSGTTVSDTSCSGVNCTTSTTHDNVCTSRTSDTLTHYELEFKNNPYSTTSNTFELSSSGTYSYDVVEGSNNIETDVYYYDAYRDDKDYKRCTGESDITTYGCTGTGGCSPSGSETYYTSTGKDHDSSYSTETFDLYYEEVDLVEELVFSLDPTVNQNKYSSVRGALFDGTSFKGSSYTPEADDGDADGGEIPYVRDEGETHFSYQIGFNDEHQSNSYAVSRSTFRLEVNGIEFVSERKDRDSMNADGAYGHGDGFVMMTHDVNNEDEPDESKDSYWEITGSTPGFGEESCYGCASHVDDSDFVTEDLVESLMKNEENIQGCPAEYTQCVASVDLQLDNLNEWSSFGPSAQPEDGVSIDVQGPYDVSQALGLAMMYEQYSSDDVNTHYSSSSGDGPPQDPEDGQCDSNRAGNWEATMKGPAVNGDLANDYQAAYEGCITEHSSCVLHGDEVPEGYVANVASDEVEVEYEAGGDSPDWEVCLNIEDPDNTPGAEWYDLDSEDAQSYLDDDHPVLDEGENSKNNISFYWRENPNPYDSDYNPRGNSHGLAIEDDCGNTDFDGASGELQDNEDLQCYEGEDEENRLNSGGFAYTFFNESKRDDDYHPQGLNRVDSTNVNQTFQGYISKLKDMSDQLEPGMTTTTYDMSDSGSSLTEEMWYPTVGNEDHADQWAITVDPSWSIDGTGKPFPPWGAYYRDPDQVRTSQNDGTRSKLQKAYGNSYAAVAGPGLNGNTDSNGNVINESDGIWIDPDELRWAWTSNGGNLFQWPSETYDDTPANNWTKMLRLDLDLTGPDSGLGYDVPGMSGYGHRTDEYGNSNTIVWGDITWETDDGSGIKEPYGSSASHPVSPGTEPDSSLNSRLEPYMCGDDRHEYLIEEMGEAPESEQLTGPYGCTSSPDDCFDSGSNQFFENGEYMQTNEPGETTGRLKQDEEYCDTNPDDLGTWYDQDFNQDACRENSLYGNIGVRWINENYVQNHPYAIEEGIDDSWSDYMAQKYSGYSKYDRYNAEASWDATTDFESQKVTPVDTGTNRSYTASLGFCGGDDSSEYMITQQSQTRFVDTDNSVVGVAASPSSCVLANDRSNIDSTTTERKLYQEGERETITTGSTTRQIACFNGQWWGDWPVVFLEDQTSLDLGETGYATFNVINPESTSRTMDLSLSIGDENLERMVSFSETGDDEMTVDIAGESTKTFSLEIQGNREIDSSDDNEIELQGISSRGDLNGYDTLNVLVGSGSNIGNDTGARRDVPGLQIIQLIVIALTSMAVFFLN